MYSFEYGGGGSVTTSCSVLAESVLTPVSLPKSEFIDSYLGSANGGSKLISFHDPC